MKCTPILKGDPFGVKVVFNVCVPKLRNTVPDGGGYTTFSDTESVGSSWVTLNCYIEYISGIATSNYRNRSSYKLPDGNRSSNCVYRSCNTICGRVNYTDVSRVIAVRNIFYVLI